ncbi:hypothetical protein [Streptomyces dysideae]|uniref:hypothetical protein n=1 Tax=Streptomyces dysideae TaxID=909626 RepID=UPI000AFB2867|nr:hypothetical protein [Streptomyces dysideae]
MAAVVNERTVKTSTTSESFSAGQRLRDADTISDTVAADGGASGSVTTDSGTYDVWVGVVDRRLTGECHCADASAATLCPHAVALALNAIACGLRWAPAPARDADAVDPQGAYGQLTAAEKGQVLEALLAERPGLRADVGRLAVALLDGPGSARHGRTRRAGTEGLRQETAVMVEDALRELEIEDLRTGHQPGFGYVDVHEAAGSLVEEALEPYKQDITRRLGLGLTGAAREIALGLLDALAACEGDYDGDQVLNYAGEDLAHAYGWGVREQLRAAGAPLPEDE